MSRAVTETVTAVLDGLMGRMKPIRGGDRQANAALHRMVQTLLRVDPCVQDYYERRTREGKTRREIVRCRKH
ncbi:IS110 family transposase [Streptomyces yunnanensis]|uniref:IS110 family transposase n=1 Tax=Streptomyces yunnanensis TaxID=156453 RepID=A0ABY8AR71_9ACTN|nr:hypothetical protein [Streptomyces yunnanensis]WEB46136.1 IS110 family transposase [Streptomyces yunnanensis]